MTDARGSDGSDPISVYSEALFHCFSSRKAIDRQRHQKRKRVYQRISDGHVNLSIALLFSRKRSLG